MGGLDKGFSLIKNRPLIEHVIHTAQNQVDDIIFSANRNIKKHNQYTAIVFNDSASDYRGPLAGIAACLRHCRHDMVLVLAWSKTGVRDNASKLRKIYIMAHPTLTKLLTY